MESKIKKYGVWLTQSDMAIIEEALKWLENTSHTFDDTSKIGAIKNLKNDLLTIRLDGPQIVEKVRIPDEHEVFNIECKECD